MIDIRKIHAGVLATFAAIAGRPIRSQYCRMVTERSKTNARAYFDRIRKDDRLWK